MTRIPPWGFVLALLTVAAAPAAAGDQANATGAAASTAGSGLSPIDYNFVAQANLGAPFQIDSGRIAEQKATTSGIRQYAHLMVVTIYPSSKLSRLFCATNGSPLRRRPCCRVPIAQ